MMNIFKYNFELNLKESSIDERDLVYKNSGNEELPNTLDYRNELLGVRNQGSQGTCYAQSAATMKEWQEKHDYGLNEYFSPQFFYNNRDYWNNNIKEGEDKNEDYGMTGRNVMKILMNVGICKESDYPYGKIQKADEIDESIKIKAKKHCIKKYARIYDIENLKASLYYNGPCLIAFPVYNYGPEMWKPKNNETISGGHAMTVVGYTKDSFIIRNSWGWYWNYGGYCYYKFSDWGCHWELWTTLDEETVFDDNEETEPSDIDNEENENDETEVYNCFSKLFKRIKSMI